MQAKASSSNGRVKVPPRDAQTSHSSHREAILIDCETVRLSRALVAPRPEQDGEIGAVDDARLVEIADPGEGESGPVGRHARTNFEAAVAAVELVAGAVDREARRVALERAGLRGRLELVREEPPVILDVAHNPDGLAAVLEALPELAGDRPLFVVFGCLDDRDPESLLEPFRGRAERLFACLIPDSGGPVGRAGLDPALIAGAAEGLEIPASVIPDPAGALAAAVGEAEAAGAAVLACGSHGLIAEIGRLQP